MNEIEKRTVQQELRRLLDSDPSTEGMTIRPHGTSFVLGRLDPDPNGPYSSPEPDDRVRLTATARGRFTVSVRRHTGRWEKTPFSGTLEQVHEAICATMQHLVMPW